MSRVRSRLIVYALLFLPLDALVVTLAYLAAFAARYVETLEVIPSPIPIIAIATTLTIVLFGAAGVYWRRWDLSSGREARRIIVVGVIAAVATWAVNAVLRLGTSWAIIALGGILTICGCVFVRYRTRLAQGVSWRWRAVWLGQVPENNPRVLIVGAGEAGHSLAIRLKHLIVRQKYTVVGFVDDDPRKLGYIIEGGEVLGNRSAIPDLVKQHRVDIVVIAIHNIGRREFQEILSYCQQSKAEVKIMPDVVSFLESHHASEVMRDVEFQDIIGRPALPHDQVVKDTPLAGKVILVTGAAGSIGSELSRQLLQYAPTKVIFLDNNESGLYDLEMDLQQRAYFATVEIVCVLADITLPNMLEAVFRKHRPQIVFHAAAYKHVPMLEKYASEAVRVNVGGTLNLVKLAHQYHVERFILISTDKAVDPINTMGASKRLCEEILLAYAHQHQCQTRFASVRFGNVYGSRGSVVPLFLRQIESGGPVTVTDSEMTRFFMTIPEAVMLVIQAACMTTGNERFFLQMGDSVKILDLARRLIELRGLRPDIDIPIEFTGIRPGEKLHEELLDQKEQAEPTTHPYILRICPPDNLKTSGVLEGTHTLLNSDFHAHSSAELYNRLISMISLRR